MQTKKEFVQEAIYQSAMKEFLDKGYEKASLRKIVKGAGTTLGNFYNYYDNKEALYASIVEDAYNGMLYLINNHHEWERRDELWDLQDVEIWRRELKALIQPLVPAITSPFVILMEGSGGTKFAHVKEDLIQMLEMHFVEHMEKFNPKYQQPKIARVMAEQLVFALVMIVKKHENENERHELIVEEILFFAIGVMGILKVF